MKIFFLLLSFAIFNFQAFSIDVKGLVQSSKTQSIENNIVTLWSTKDSSAFKHIILEKEGNYQFSDVPSGSYFIEVTGVPFQTDSSNVFVVTTEDVVVPTIVLKTKTNTLQGASVVAKKPFIEVKADKTIVNVESSINATGSNALDILRKSPGVTVDKDDNISLKGKSGVVVYIDGKQTYLDNATIASILKGTQSNMIESIEIITQPSAKYDAAGNAGIINIKLKKNKKLGTNGNASMGLNYGYTPKTNGSISINNNNLKTNYFLLYGYDIGNTQNFTNFLRQQNGKEYNQSSISNSFNNAHNFKVGADYKLSDTKTIGIMTNGNLDFGYWNNASTSNIGEIAKPISEILVARNDIPANRKNINGNLNYKFSDTNGTTLNIDVDAGLFNSISNSYQPNTYKNTDGTPISVLNFRNYAPTNINIYTAKIDYELNKWKGKLGIGAKTSVVISDNDFKFYQVINNIDQLSLESSNHFKYTENVNAIYANYNKQINKKWSTQVGLRIEQTNSKGVLKTMIYDTNKPVQRQYIDPFPSASLSFSPNQNNQFALSFSRRIDRPSYQNLNPFEFKLDELSYEKGNPFLRPQYAYNTELSHTFMGFLSSSLSYSRITDLFSQITDTASGARAYITNKNLASSDVFGINIGSPIPIKKWWFAYVNVGANYTFTKANFNGNIINNKYPSANFYGENNFTLPKQFSASISGWYAIPTYWGGTFKTNPVGALDIGVQKTLFNKKMTAKISMTDVLWSQNWRGISDFAGLYFDANGGAETRQLRLTVSYRFGSTTIQAARERQTGSSNEADRIKGGK